MIRVFLDANVLFTAAHNPYGKASLVIELGSGGRFELFTSEYAREEAARNLSAKFPGSLPRLDEIIARLTFAPVNLSAPYPPILAAKDAAIFQAAVACRADYLLTGDLKHFGPLMNRPELCYSVDVRTVANFLAALGI